MNAKRINNRRNVKKVERLVVSVLGVGLLMSLAFNKIQHQIVKDAQDILEVRYNKMVEIKDNAYDELLADLEVANARIDILENELDLKNKDFEQLEVSTLIDVGEFEITNYTLAPDECGKDPSHPYYGITASGKTATVGETVASDWGVLPNGTKVYIDGVGIREVQDSGNLVKGKVLDVFVGDPVKDKTVVSRAKEFGRQKRRVWVINDKTK